MKRSLAAIFLMCAPAFADSYTFQTINFPGSTTTDVSGINDSGQLTGTYRDASGGNSFLYSNGSFTQIPAVGSVVAAAVGINNAGAVLISDPAGGQNQFYAGPSYLYQNGILSLPLNPIYSNGIPNPDNPFVFHGYADAIAISDAGILFNAAGTTVLNSGQTIPFGTFLLNGSSVSSVSTNGNVVINNISNNGEIVGSQFASNGIFNYQVGYISTSTSNGAFSSYSVPDSIDTIFRGVNDSGEIVGSYTSSSNEIAGLFLPIGFIYVNGVATDFVYPGAQYSFPTSVNDEGVIAGIYADSNGEHGFIATPVPEANAFWLVLPGLLALKIFGFARRAA